MKKPNWWKTAYAVCVLSAGALLPLVIAQAAQAQTFSVIYTFMGGDDGASPNSALVADAAGNLYGTTEMGGSSKCFGNGCGTVFAVDSGGNESVVHAFTGGGFGTDGWAPNGVTRDLAGNLYGTAWLGGQYGNGTIFEVTATGQFLLLYMLDQGGSVKGAY